MGGVQKRRTLIVSKLESFYDTSSNNGFKKRALVNSLRTLKVVRIGITDMHWQLAHIFYFLLATIIT